jgi:hypothetical protein
MDKPTTLPVTSPGAEKERCDFKTSAPEGQEGGSGGTKVPRYFASLTERQQQGFRVAEAQLKTTFNVEKTHGYIEWQANKP